MSNIKYGFIADGKEYKSRDDFLKEILMSLLDSDFNIDKLDNKVSEFKKLLGGQWIISNEERFKNNP